VTLSKTYVRQRDPDIRIRQLTSYIDCEAWYSVTIAVAPVSSVEVRSVRTKPRAVALSNPLVLLSQHWIGLPAMALKDMSKMTMVIVDVLS
jgi:hypothetical protein